MDDPAGRLHPLVAAAGGQIASLDHQIGYLEKLYEQFDDPAVFEIAEQRLERLREERRKFRGIHDRLQEKLVSTPVGLTESPFAPAE